MATRTADVYVLPNLRTGELPHTSADAIAPRPAVRWTRYGYWNDEATQVFNERGVVIYNAKSPPARPRR